MRGRPATDYVMGPDGWRLPGQAQAQAAIESESHGGPGKRSQATMLVELTHDAKVELWHDPEQCPWATIPVGGHREHRPLGSRPFRNWLKQAFFEASGKAPGTQAVQDALGVLEGEALYVGQEEQVSTRLAEHDGAIYLDLANNLWGAVKITSSGWSNVADPPVRFRRSRGMRPLPYPVKGGNLNDLRPLVNVPDEDWPLVLAWLVAALRPTGPYPLLILHGEQGNAKSTTERVLRELIDPNAAPLRAEPKEARDLMIAANNSWVTALDNVGHLAPWLSDALCRLATGGGFATRELYTNDEEALFDAQRPVILNAIEELATRGDLLDRAIISYLPVIPEDKRCSERTFWARFRAAHPCIMGALLDAVAHALDNVGQVKLNQLPRMADFAVWACAAAPALGFTQKDFLDAYGANRKAAHSLTLEASPVYSALLALLEGCKGKWEGTATELLGALNGRTTEATQQLKGWPKNGRALSNRLRRLAPSLRAVSVQVDFDRKGEVRRRTISLEKVENFASFASPSSATHTEVPFSANAKTDANSALPSALAPSSRYEADAKEDKDANISALSNPGGGVWRERL